MGCEQRGPEEGAEHRGGGLHLLLTYEDMKRKWEERSFKIVVQLRGVSALPTRQQQTKDPFSPPFSSSVAAPPLQFAFTPSLNFRNTLGYFLFQETLFVPGN